METFLAVDIPRTVRTRTRSMLARRAVSLPVAVVGFPVLILLTPLILVLTLIADLFLAPRRLATTRLFLAVAGYAFWTVVVQIAIALVWVASGFGARNWRPATQRRWARLTRFWTHRNLAWFGRVLGYETVVEDLEQLHSGPLLVFARHESIFDALLPPGLVVRDPSMSIRVVLMRELRREPCLDLVAHRAPHHFVERSGEDPEAEIEAIGRLAAGLPNKTAVVIFPEGRLYRPAVRARNIERLDEAGDTVGAARASELRHVLAPRTGGTLALLANAPSGTDVAFVGHVGYHQLTDLATVWRSIPLSQPIEVVVMRRRSDEIPDDEPERVAWIHANWRLLDDWIAERREARGWASVAT